MKRFVPVCLGLFLIGFAPLPAGSVVSIIDGAESAGPLTLTPTTLNVQTISSLIQINHADILEATFGEVPFHLDAFSSAASGQLPSAWKSQDIGTITSPGYITETTGLLTVNSCGADPRVRPPRNADQCFFAGQPWTGNGQWTVRLREIDHKETELRAGLMLRETFNPDSPMSFVAATTTGNGNFGFRDEVGSPQQGGAPFSLDIPVWLRLTRYGQSIFGSISSDGLVWSSVAVGSFKSTAAPWIGLYSSARRENGMGKAVLDQVYFTPVPSEAQVLPPGVLLQSGSFLAGRFEHLEFDPANPDSEGNFVRGNKSIPIPRSKIAAVIMLPTDRSMIGSMGSRVGVLMKNGDVMDGDFSSISWGQVTISSVLLGITSYHQDEVNACLLHPVNATPAAYEFRLRDGSIIEAGSFKVGAGGVAIDENSGQSITVTPDEIAQVRAGAAQVQNLTELNWKATAPAASAPATNAPAINAPPAPDAQAAPVLAPIPDLPDPSSAAESWEGPNQEQIIKAPLATPIEFTLPGKFRAIGVKVALSPDSPPNSNLTVRVLVDGKEAARTPPFRAGEQPRYMQLTVSDPKTVTLEADSVFTVAKVLFIDPVAIRDK